MEKATLLIALMVFLLSGCATKGRFAVLDLDLRTPEQIEASVAENTIIYTCTNNIPAVAQPKVSVDPWDIIVRIISVVKGRLRILSIEWNEK